jgi:hypothetical protein
MQVTNIHECELQIDTSAAGVVIDSLATSHDIFWPDEQWPSISFDRPICVGAMGGHGAIRYVIDVYQPGQLVKCRFTRPSGFQGYHWLEVLPDGQHNTILRHTIHMRIYGWTQLSWFFMIRPLHDALLEDALYQVRIAMGMSANQPRWSLWVRLVRMIYLGGRRLLRTSQVKHPC